MSKWYDDTSLDFSLLDDERQNNVTRLATSTQHFYEKYILPNNKNMLENDLVVALETTEEYAVDLADKIFCYFTSYYSPKPPVTQPSFQPNPYAQLPSQPAVGGSSKDEIAILLRDVKLEILQSCNEQLAQQKELYTQQIEAANKEVASLKQEISNQSSVLRKLADSYNSLRQFVQEWTSKHQTLPLAPSGASLQASSISSGVPPYQVTSSSVPSYQSLPPTAPPQYPPPPGVLPIGYGASADIPSPYGSHMDESHLIPRVSECVFLEGTKNLQVTWYKNLECRVFVDYIAAEPCIACTWKIQSLRPNGIIKLGFIYDTAFDMKEQDLRDQGCEVRNDNLFVIRKVKERYEGFVQGDTIRIELALSRRVALFFKNDRQLPFVFFNTPNSCRFYVIGSGIDTSVEMTDLVSMPQTTELPNKPFIKEYDILKSG